MGHGSRAAAKRNASVLTTEFAAQIPPLGRRCALHPLGRLAAAKSAIAVLSHVL